MTNKVISILYADDNKLSKEEEIAISQFMSFLKFISKNLYYSRTLKESLSLVKLKEVDLIISNIDLEKEDEGIIFAKEAEYKKIPTILFGDRFSKDLIKKIENLHNLRGFLLSPIDLSLLLEKIEKIAEEVSYKKEEEEKNKLLKEYKLLVDETLSISKTDKRGIITYINDKFSKISGFSKEEAIGSYHNIIRHQDTTKETYKDMWETILNKKTWKGTVKNKNKYGEEYYVASTIIPILDNTGEIKEFISLRKNITEEVKEQELIKKENQKLLEYENKLKETLFLIRLDLNLNILFCNHPNKYIKKHLEKIKKEKPTIIEDILLEKTKELSIKTKHLIYNFSIKLIKDKNDKIEEIMAIGKNVSEVINLHKEIEFTQKDIILSLGTIGEKRSKETGNHVKRVAEFSYLLSRLYGLSEKEAELIKNAAPMHDIGKVGIPDEILNKPARLTPEEFEIMKEHSAIGYDMLKSSKRELLKTSAIIAHEHHEKWNGNGYPKGLKGEEIHIYGRIVGLVDVYDALASERIYKKAWSNEEIINYFKRERGEQFDPKLIDLFLENIDKFEEIKERLKD